MPFRAPVLLARLAAAAAAVMVAIPASPASASVLKSEPVLTSASVSASDSGTTTTVPPPAKAELLVDVDTGKVLYGQNAYLPLPPGSLTKMLTAMIAVDWLPSNTLIPVNALTANVYPNRVGMKPGQLWPFNITMHALLVASDNDAAYALGQKVGGSLGGFAKIMQQAAAQIGMTHHPVLEDPAGLDGTEGYDNGNRISAWDLAVAGRDMMANPYLAAIADTRKFVFTGPDKIVYSIISQNLGILNGYPGAIGVKTGFTDAAGLCVVSEAERGGRKMMAVVLNGSDSYTTAKDLMDKGFATPVAAESVNAPTLPPIMEPHRPPKPKPTTTVPPTREREATARDGITPLAAAAAPTPTPVDGNNAWTDAGISIAAVAVLGGGALYLASRRKRPGDGQNRH